LGRTRQENPLKDQKIFSKFAVSMYFASQYVRRTWRRIQFWKLKMRVEREKIAFASSLLHPTKICFPLALSAKSVFSIFLV
jgi:hypothetical protein